MKDFSGKSNIYTQALQGEILQGDCWENLPYFDVTGQRQDLKVMLLSNSCDIDQKMSDRRQFT